METTPVLKKKSIYNIESEYIELMNKIEDAEGELSPELSQQLDITKAELEVKATNYGYLVMQLDTDTEQIDAEIKRLKAMKDAKARMQEELKTRVADAMKRFGIDKIEKNNLKLSFRKSSAISIAPDAKIPKQFLIVDLTPTVDKRALKTYVESGKKVKGVMVVENKSLQIK
jgi:hypothetical protein